MERSGLLAAGNFIVDHVKIIDTYPHEDGLATIQEESISNGGSPYNVLVDLAKLGVSFPLAAAGLIGKDAYGEYILNDCQQYQIDTTALNQTVEARTSYTDVMSVASTGRRTFFHHRGANSYFDGQDLDFSSLPYKMFHLGYLLLLDALDQAAALSGAAHLLHRAIEAGYQTSVDVVSESSDRFKTIIPHTLPFVDFLFVNEYEAGQITGITLEEMHPSSIQVRRAADNLLEMGVRKWVFIHFPGGVWAFSKKGDTLFQPSLSIPSTAIKGAAGAGDALAAGILLGIHEEWPMAQSLRLGVCAAGCSLFDPTASGHIPTMAEVLSMVDQYPFQRVDM